MTIKEIFIDEKLLLHSSRNKNARDRAITDILDNNSFGLDEDNGPFSLNIEISQNKFVMKIYSGGEFLGESYIPLSPLKTIIKDYHIICESYFDAVKVADPRKVEAIDMGRRGVHDEGAGIIEDLLDKKISTDFETSRKLFSLIYVLQRK